MKVTFISDTHCKQNFMNPLPGGDILIFSGDAMSSGYKQLDLVNFISWVKDQPYTYKVCIAGNHDRFAEDNPHITADLFKECYDNGVRYVCDEMIEIEGLKIYGTPYQPYFCNWAFNVINPDSLYNRYKMIPEGLDILITHCPPFDILDKSHKPRPFYGRTGEEPLGSNELKQVIDELGENAPRYHAFGHIHGDGGNVLTIGNTTYINASVCNEAYDPLNKIVTLDIEPTEKRGE